MYSQYNTISAHPYIPNQAFLYFPSGDSSIHQQDDFKLILPTQEVKRLIYQGGIQYTEQQKQKIEKFKKFVFSCTSEKLLPQWSDALIYKFLQSTNYDYKRSKQQIIKHNEYQVSLRNLNFQDLRIKTEQILKQGVIYFNGRDSKYRPIVIVDIGRIYNLKLTQQKFYNTLQYFFQFLYRNMFINGQVQNVVSIIDVNNIGPFNLISPMKMTISFLQGNYKYKMFAMYILRTTSMFNYGYKIAKQFMRQDTIRKLNIIPQKQCLNLPLLKYCNVSQLEQKFGGTHANLTKFWPPEQFSDEYGNQQVHTNHITKQKYKQMYKQGLLLDRKINRQFIIGGSDTEIDIPLVNKNIEQYITLKKIQSQRKLKASNQQKQQKLQNRISRLLEKANCRSCFGIGQ